MAADKLASVLDYVRRLAADVDDAASDRQLLARFLGQRDEAAFTALVRRHGPMVWGVCRRALKNDHDAEDAFQATFLVLARKAASIRRLEVLGSWLHGVAWHVAVKARAKSAVRQARERQVRDMQASVPDAEAAWRDLAPILDEEVRGLPAKYRDAVILCYFEGKTHAEAARELDRPVGSMSRLLARARELLHEHLTRRGVSLPAGLLAAALAAEASAAAVPCALLPATVKAALSYLTGTWATVAPLSARAAALANQAVKGMVLGKIKMGGAVVLALTLLSGGIGGLTVQLPHAAEDNAKPQEKTNPPTGAKEAARPNVEEIVRDDRYGDPLPEGAIARMGTVRWRLGAFLTDCMVVSPDGKSLLAAHPQSGLTVLEMETGRTVRQIPLEPGAHADLASVFGSVAVSADGRTAVFGAKDGTVYLTDVLTGKERRRLVGHSDRVSEAALSADGTVLVTRSDDQTLRIWDTASGKELRRLAVNAQIRDQYRTAELALSSDGKTFAWIGNDKVPLLEDKELVVHVCDTATGQERHRLLGHVGFRRRVTFSPDGLKLVTTSDGQKLVASGDGTPGQIWDVKSGRLLQTFPINQKNIAPLSFAFSPDGKTLVITVGGEGTRLVDVATGKDLWRIPRRAGSTILDVFAFAPEGKTLLLCAAEHLIRRFDMATGKPLLLPEGPTRCSDAIAFSPDRRSLYSLGDPDGRWFYSFVEDGGVFRHWDAEFGRQIYERVVKTSTGVFSTDGRLLALGRKEAILLVETATGKELRQFAIRPGPSVGILALSSDGKLLAAWVLGSDERSVVLWETATGKELRRIPIASADYLTELMFTPDGNTLLGVKSAQWMPKGEPLYAWDVCTGRARSWPGAVPRGTLARLSPDGKTLVVPSEWKSIDFIETASGQKRLELPPLTIWPSALRFSRDGSLFLVSDNDGSIGIYDSFTGRLLRRLHGHSGRVLDFAFSNDGRKLASASTDTTILVWDLAKLVPKAAPPMPLAEKELATLWGDLRGSDAAKAYRAMAVLRAAPAQGVPFLHKHVRPAPAADSAKVTRLIRDLDDEQFAVREKAAQELSKLGEAAEPALQQAQKTRSTLEFRRRVEQLLAILAVPSGDTLRSLRAVEVLEHIGGTEAEKQLEVLSKGAREARLTQEAKAALARLAPR